MTAERADPAERERRDVPGKLVDRRRSQVERRIHAGDGWIHAEEELRLKAGDRLHHTWIVRRAPEQLGDQAAQVLEARADAVLDDQVERRRRVRHLAADQLVDPRIAAVRRDALEKDPDVDSQLLLRRGTLARLPGAVAGAADFIDRHPHNGSVETELVVEVVVDSRDIGARRAADLANRDVLESAPREQPGRRFEQPLVCFLILHSVRLNSIVAAAMATTENSARYTRSPVIAPKPVFLSRRLLRACTAYVKGSTSAIACIQGGKPCCG